MGLIQTQKYIGQCKKFTATVINTLQSLYNVIAGAKTEFV